nr:zinc finger, CCHC-type [Tanacetum cinerariifolium]
MITTLESCLYYYYNGRNLKGLSAEEAWETIKEYAQCDKKWKNPTSTISYQTIAKLKDQLVGNEVVRVKIPSFMSWLDAYDEPFGDLDMIEDKVENSDPQSTPQALPSFEENTPPITYPDEVKKIIRIPIERRNGQDYGPTPNLMMTFANSDWRRHRKHKACRRDQSSDGIGILTTASGRGRLKKDLESSTWRRRQEHKATPSLFHNPFSSTSMGDKNHIRTLGDYSKPSHEGYMNTIELPVGNNVVPLRSDTIQLQHQGESLSKAWTRFKDLLRKVPHHGINLWLQVQIFYDRIDRTLKQTMDYVAEGRLRKISAEKAWATIEELARYENKGWNNPIASGEGSLDYKNPNIKQLLGVMKWKLREEIRIEQNRTKKIKKITRYPDTEDLKPLNDHKFSKNLTKEFTTNPLSFEVYTQPVSYPDELEEIIEIPMKVEPLDETQLEDLSLNTCNHNIPISSREILCFDESEPQPNPLPNCPSLDVSLVEERGPIKPHSSDSFRMKEVDSLTIHTPPLPHVASFHLKDLYCYYHPCIDDPKKHYGFKPGRRLNSPIGPKEVENVRIKETHHLEHTIQQQFFLSCDPFSQQWLYLTKRNLEVLRKFYLMILGG